MFHAFFHGHDLLTGINLSARRIWHQVVLDDLLFCLTNLLTTVCKISIIIYFWRLRISIAGEYRCLGLSEFTDTYLFHESIASFAASLFS